MNSHLGLTVRDRSRWGVVRMCIAMCASLFALTAVAAERPLIRVGVLKFGTVNWELAAMAERGFDEAAGFELEVVPFASGEATEIAVQGGEVDVIVSDWLWVSRQRAAGQDLSFAPYSTAVGALMVAEDGPIKTLADLKDRKIGVAGGPLDKSWLLLQGDVRQRVGINLAEANEIVFGAPPLLAEKAASGELDAVLNYWHYCARLEARGFRELMSAQDAAESLGATGAVSAIGYVFSEARAESVPIDAFLEASRNTKSWLQQSDRAWTDLADSGVIKDEGVALERLRERYRAGIPARALADEIADAEHIYRLLAELGGAKLVGDAPEMVEGTYWVRLQ